MLHRVVPSLEFDAEPEGLKKSWIHLASALECLAADTIIQAAATANAAEIARPCNVTYRLYEIVFSLATPITPRDCTAVITKQIIAKIQDANEGVDVPTMEGVATARIPTRRLTTMCSIKVRYMPALTSGMAQQQYSLAFMMRRKW